MMSYDIYNNLTLQMFEEAHRSGIAEASFSATHPTIERLGR
jgi:hypothetical protein